MGKGRAPCCDKSQVKRGPWSPSEDMRLITFIQKNGHENWRALPKQAGLVRCGKSCRLRWINYLRPDVKRGNFTREEEDTIIQLQQTWGNKWSKIASHLPGRTDNEIKNVWNTHLKKRLAFKEAVPEETNEISTASFSSSSSSTVMSSGQGDMGMELDHHWDQESETKKPHVLDIIQDSRGKASNELRPNKEPKELSSSSVSSNNSNITNSSQVDVSKPEDQMGGSKFEFGGLYDFQNSLDEVNKPEFQDIKAEIPLESDTDFWNMLDNLIYYQSNDVQLDHDVQSRQCSNVGGAYDGEVENKKWLRFLENELGLEEPKINIGNQENVSQYSAEPLVPIGIPQLKT